VGELYQRLRIRPTIDLYYDVRDGPARSQVDRAFRVLFLNRTCFSGLVHGYPIGGAPQFSRFKVFSHYDGKQLVREIEEAHDLLKGRTMVTRKDGAVYVRENLTAAKYLDPPYFRRGDYSYRQKMTLADHLRLAEALRQARNWVLSYDDCAAITGMYAWADCYAISALYRVNQRRKKCVTGKELVIVPRG
jgi:DNA adenine methylase